MDLLKTPSMQSLLDSDLESVESLQYLDIEELDEVEYALPPSNAPTLAEVLSADEGDGGIPTPNKNSEEPYSCSTLQVDFLQAISQQLAQAQERSSAGTATSLSVGIGGKLTVGTAHGQILSFFEQTLRWVCNSNVEKGAVSCLSYNQDSTRLLAGYAQGLICQYESIRGILLRRVTLGGDIWGVLRVTWAGTSGLALDTGGSVWLIKFSRPLGVRAARTSCLFSGARGEVVAMTARDARILALATLSRVIIVAGGRAAGIRLGGPPDTLPVLEWCEADDKVLVCGRAKTLQWLSVTVTGSSISLRPLQRVELKSTPLWLGWLGGNLAIFDANENLRLWGEDYDKPLDLSNVEPVYASAFFKGLFTDGRVSRAMCKAGVSALGGVCVLEGALSLLGRRGIVRVRPRDLIARAKALLSSGHHLQALKLLCTTQGSEVKALANQFIVNVSERPHLLSNRNMAEQIIKLCLKLNLSNELWTTLWEHCSSENAFVEALGDAAVRGDFATKAPSPDSTQALIERLAEFEPGLVERVVASLPFIALDPHRASVFTRERKLWRGVGAIAAALGGSSGAVRELAPHVQAGCGGAREGRVCTCAGDALVLAAADALAGRGAAGRPLPDHARPSARHDALHALLAADVRCDGQSPLRVMVMHDASAAVRLLEQSAREPPFAGPLAKQNRLRVARALLEMTPELQDDKARTEILEFITGQLSTGALPSDQEVVKGVQELAVATSGERADRAWVTLAARAPAHSDRLRDLRELAAHRPRVLWKIDAILHNPDEAIQNFFRIIHPSPTDADEFFEYVQTKIETDGDTLDLEPHLPALISLRPRAAAAIIPDRYLDKVAPILETAPSEKTLDFAECLLESGRLQGDSAAAYLKALGETRPADVADFLARNPGVVRPERALAIVREINALDAEAACLEAAGDPSRALDTILRRARLRSGDEAAAAAAVAEAAELCVRVASNVPPAVAEEMWTRLLGSVDVTPAALLLEAAAYVPVEKLIAHAGSSGGGALALLGCAASRRSGWACAARVAGREAHEAVARALAAARRGLAVRGRCVACALRLAALPPVRTLHCARAAHADCGTELTCACGRRVPDALWTPPPPPQNARRSTSSPQEHALRLIAPPRPDLEGIV
ncbi:unnamed protein product [Chilo suppressalis]|uniref:Vacuolar protein sorting-associated protein 8 central domain-containing protein n=1 Tax=Chilo suppressalis TaxID=168631 RepID=A0ABN8AVI3_CHISP|nr:unnamed protein product [Chilo suppressalis]